MSPRERTMIQKVDEIILNSTEQELSQIQALDKKTQLSGSSFYDVFLECYCDKVISRKSSSN